MQLVGQITSAVDFTQGLDNAGGVDAGCPGLDVGVNEVEHQRLNVAVEDQPDDFACAVDDRAAGVTADDVGRADKVKRRGQVELVLGFERAFGQFPTAACCRGPRRAWMVAAQRRDRFDLLARLAKAFDRAEGQPQREGGVGIGVRAGQLVLGPRDLGIGLAERFVDLFFEVLRTLRAGSSTSLASRIIGSVEASIAFCPPSASFCRAATSFSSAPCTSSTARSCGDLPARIFCTRALSVLAISKSMPSESASLRICRSS